MDHQTFESRYQVYRQAVEAYLEGLFASRPHWADLYDAMRYSLLAGGKRIRPVLTLEFARIAGMDWHDALPAACALELVHTYSLIHDDLPCMDDDDLRRGKPTNHKVYGETLAVLAEAAGADGMVAGQVLDTLHAPKTEAELTEVHRLKTGAMIAGACRMGVAAAGGGDALDQAARAYAEELGLAFQIRDDLLDVVGDEATFGKPIGSDKEEGKVTFVDLLGVDGCDAAVRAATKRAEDAVAALDADGFLSALASSLAERKQ